jgi:hypothetical protein
MVGGIVVLQLNRREYIQVQPGAVQSKLKRMLNEMGERRALYIPLIRPLSERIFVANIILLLRL